MINTLPNVFPDKEELNIHITEMNMPCLSILKNLAGKQISTVFPFISITSLDLPFGSETYEKHAYDYQIVFIISFRRRKFW